MLELSETSVKGNINQDNFESFRKLAAGKNQRVLKRSLFVLLAVLIVLLCLPWTQNISGNGRLTSLRPDQRPQAIQTVIPGRIEQWYVSEGDFVKMGDTIMRISEIKDDYFDPNLLVNVEDQIKSKESSVSGYMQKVEALDRQIDALNESAKLKRSQQELKIKQSILKVQSDSMDFNVAKGNAVIAKDQYERFKSLYEKGLKSETELEQREVVFQNARAKQVETENKLLISRQELTNVRTELNSISQDYRDKISKAESDKFSTMSMLYDTEAQVTKLQSQYAGYSQRSGFYFITSPADGYVTRAIHSGGGETIKEGEEIVSLMPANYELAVELMVKPIDYPLISKGQKVRFIFDGWPAFVFSGWPGASAGTYGGVVVAIDNFTNNKGEYRILVAPDPSDVPWPTGIRVGAGARGMALLKDVPLGYELWRQFNGFPPNYYKADETKEAK
ncbi:MAG: HlyD family secretion protein [Flavobacteriales bacterium]